MKKRLRSQKTKKIIISKNKEKKNKKDKNE